MSGLDLEALRLTREERLALPGRDTYFAGHKWAYATVEEAQLAKALWGYHDYLKSLEGIQREHSTIRLTVQELQEELALALEQANIERPERNE